jgi:hypothetical protein
MTTRPIDVSTLEALGLSAHPGELIILRAKEEHELPQGAELAELLSVVADATGTSVIAFDKRMELEKLSREDLLELGYISSDAVISAMRHVVDALALFPSEERFIPVWPDAPAAYALLRKAQKRVLDLWKQEGGEHMSDQEQPQASDGESPDPADVAEGAARGAADGATDTPAETPDSSGSDTTPTGDRPADGDQPSGGEREPSSPGNSREQF